MLYLATRNNNLYSREQNYTTKVAENCYVWTSNDTRTKRSVLLYIMKEVGINPSDLELELVPLNDNAISDSVED